ncbi:hypothetical protein [Actinoallomurus rhizosphaericola]|nr:hypothetical protein [Actinoallomurus rhizosphaericola]MCO5998637.1 hypothetical protein [Actinoallomurus rhizosphaericola]
MIVLTCVIMAVAALGAVVTRNVVGPIGSLFALATVWYQRARDVRRSR